MKLFVQSLLIFTCFFSELKASPCQQTIFIDLSNFESKTYSQNGEDGVLNKIFECIGAHSRYYVEFGTENGSECNTRCLKESGWRGLLMDGNHDNPDINLHKEFITAENINELFKKYEVPHEFDLLSIDIDFNDFHVWKAIENSYKPRVVVIEYNATHLPSEDKVIKYDAKGGWDGSNYFGASILALYNLGRLKGYSLIYAEKKGVNLFFIRDDVLSNLEASGFTFKNKNLVQALYMFPRYGIGPNGGHREDALHRLYQSSHEILSSS